MFLVILIMFFNSFFIVLVGTICKFNDINLILNLKMIIESLKIAILVTLSLFPVFYIATLTKSGTALSISINFVYNIIGIIGLNNLVGIHPLSSVFNILFNSQIGKDTNSVAMNFCILNIIIVSIFILLCNVIINKIKLKQ